MPDNRDSATFLDDSDETHGLVQLSHRLETAAIIGTEVPFPVLRSAVQLSTDVLNDSLSRLRTAQFLVETQDYPNSTYSFRHALVHSSTLQGMLTEQRKLQHQNLLRVIAANHGAYAEEHVERMAEHALQAEAWEDAVRYLTRSADLAFKRSANGAALGYSVRLLSLDNCPDGQRRQRSELALQKLRGVPGWRPRAGRAGIMRL